ncbi:hypothetical protein LTR37_008339 [Vermiconidia calcicola]|uniref:Uncharacterized protein n=1 Tax=Vermiconidia calcicola TaxID=1690605 RepID=A0ACC3NBF9_9PEZI|nr:hypothetical protein LTR37_008339 [Vermiconidia calcicola]
MSTPTSTQPDPLAGLQDTFENILARSRALNSNIKAALSTIRRAQQTPGDDHTITISDHAMQHAAKTIEMGEYSVSKLVQSHEAKGGPFSITEFSLLMGICLVTDCLANVLGVEQGREYREARDKVFANQIPIAKDDVSDK